jgi:integrase
MANHFLDAQLHKESLGELTPKSIRDYRHICRQLIEHLGAEQPIADLAPVDFQHLLQAWRDRNPTTRGNLVRRAKIVLNYAWHAGLVETPIRTGPDFRKPSYRSRRQYERTIGPRLFTRAEIHTLLEAADPAMRAMIYLGINCALEPHDCGKLQRTDYDPAAGYLEASRWKTGVPRRCPLWPETRAAIDAYLPTRARPHRPEWAGCLFLSSRGYSLWRDHYTPISTMFEKLLKKTDMKRPRMGFLWLRHTFATVAGAVPDRDAIKMIMGHADHSMLANYQHEIADTRLEAITDHVRRWLRGEEKQME